MTPPPLSIFPVTLLSTFSHKIEAHSVLQRHPPLLSRTCNKPCLPPNELKILDVPIHLSCHFSVRTHQKGTLQPNLWIFIYSQDEYLSKTSIVNLSATQSPNVKILLKCEMSFESRTRITAVRNRGFTNMLQDKPLLKIEKLKFTKI